MWDRYCQSRYRQQKITSISIGKFEISIPDRHILIGLQATQPFRDGGLGLAAKHLSMKYPDKTMIDIGANIGDTAAIIATHARNPLVLVEPSDYFFSFLEKNVTGFPNKTTVVNGFVNDGSAIKGSLHHWLGTAEVLPESDSLLTEKSIRLDELSAGDVCLIKTDTDGFDYKIISAGMDYVAEQKCAVFIEVQVKNTDETVEACCMFKTLWQNGFNRFLVWDDAGWLVLSTDDVNIVTDLVYYLDSIARFHTRQSIYNYDVLCLHENDSEVASSIVFDHHTAVGSNISANEVSQSNFKYSI
jgi:FkbM family methyltransferase